MQLRNVYRKYDIPKRQSMIIKVGEIRNKLFFSSE